MHIPNKRKFWQWWSQVKCPTELNELNVQLKFGVPQGSILGPLVFNIFPCDLSLIMKKTSFASYAVDNTPYVTAENLDDVIKSLEKDSIQLFQWFSDNQMKVNHDKCYPLVSGKNNVTIIANEFKIKNVKNCEK